MSQGQDWRAFFDAHAPHYDQNVFAQNTAAEVDFFLKIFPLSPGASILDVGCGTGRHCIELAKRGYRATGVDLSPGMLEVARAKAAGAGVEVEFVEADATQFELGKTFDAGLCLCEGGFGLIGPGEDAEAHDRAILRQTAKHLVSGAPFLLTALNGYSIIRQMKDEHVADGRFDPATMIANYQDQLDLPEGPRIVTIYERLFIPPEVVRQLDQEGFRCHHVFGGTAGNWGTRPIQLDEIEVMYVCRRV